MISNKSLNYEVAAALPKSCRWKPPDKLSSKRGLKAVILASLLTLHLSLILNLPLVAAQACNGNMCFPTTQTDLMFGNNDRANCHTVLDSIDTDMWTDIFIGGRTQSMSLIRNGNHNACLDTSLTGNWAGYVTRYVGSTISWSKFFEGTEADENVVSVPFVGLSRNAGTYDQNLHKVYMGTMIKMVRSEFIVMLRISDGNVMNVQKIEANPIGSFVHSKHANNIVFQLISSSQESNLDYYRFYIGWEDNYSTNTRKQFDLRSRSPTQQKRVYDNNYAYYKFGVRALAYYYNKLYFGGARQYGAGFTPFMGYCDGSSMSVNQAVYWNDNNGNYRRHIIEKIHISRQSWDRQIIILASWYDTDFTPNSYNRWTLIVGRDTTSSNWRYNWGTWEYTSWFIYTRSNKYKWIDDAMGPFNDGSGYATFNFIFRQWDNEANWQNDAVDGVSWQMGRCMVKKYDRIYTRHGRDYNHYSFQKWFYYYGSTSYCQSNAGQLPCILKKGVASQMGSTDFFAGAHTSMFKNSYINGGRYAVVLFKPPYQSSDYYTSASLMYSYHWTHREYELRSPSTSTFTPLSTTITLNGPTLNRNIVWRIGQGTHTYDINKFGNWENDAETWYSAFETTAGNALTVFDKYASNNYTSDSTFTVNWVNPTNKNQIRVQITTINYPRTYYFYLAGNNKFYSALSDLITIDVQCPLTGGATINPSASTYTVYFVKGVSGTAANANFNPWTVTNVQYTNCGNFWKYEISGDASHLNNLVYPEPPKVLANDCPNINSCNAIRVTDTSVGRIHEFTLSMYLMYGPSPVSVNFRAVVSYCMDHTLTATANPGDELLERTSANTDDVNYQLSLSYGLLFSSSDNPNCPVQRYELLDTSGNALVHNYVSMTNPTTAATTRIIISNDASYTITVKVRAFTEEKNAEFTWNIRVCGEETLALVNSAERFYVFGHETGSTSGMADSTRYHSIPQSEFFAWFTLSPTNDPCFIKEFQIMQSSSAAWPSSNTNVLLTGSIGFYTLKLDKTQAVNGQIFYLRAVTRGLITIDQQIKYTICPRTGGVTVTPPSPTTTNPVDGTSGLRMTLASNQLHQVINYQATGTSANVNFGAWQIADAYVGCGVFWKYGVSADSSNSPFVTYPEPGYTYASNCQSLSQCLKVRILASTIRFVDFSLQIYPQYSQDPIGIPYKVDVSLCANYATLGKGSDPAILIMSRSPNAGSTIQNSIDPQWLSIFTLTYANYCPIMHLALLTTSNGAFSDNRFSLVNPESPSTARIDIANDVAFQLSFRLQAATMAKNNYITLTARVCGTETVTLVQSSARFFIDGWAAGTPSSLSDAARYMTIEQSTFEAWFNINPSNDPCIIESYSIHGTVSPLTNFPDTQVTLTGSLGSYKIKIDKTLATNSRTFYLRTTTKGLKTVDQEINFVICPRTGGSTITPPSGTSPNVVDLTGGSLYTLPTGGLHQVINYQASGSTASADFPQWSIASIYTSCGAFDRYAISGDGNNLPYLTYPEPGLTLAANCQQISQCLKVRVNTNTIRTFSFQLQLYPKYSQNPLSIPYLIDVSPCLSHATFGISNHPPTLVIDKTMVQGSIVQNAVNPTYFNLFNNNQGTNCPIMRFTQLSAGGGTQSDSRIILTNPETPATTRVDVKNDQTLLITIRLQAATMLQNAYINLEIRVCGQETIALTGGSSRFFIEGIAEGDPNGMSEATRYLVIPESTFSSWFAVSPSGDACSIAQYEIFSTISPLQLWGSDTQVALTGSLGSYKIKLDKTTATNTKTFYLRATTRGLKTVDQEIRFVICPKVGGSTITPPTAYSPTTIDVTNGVVHNLASNSLYKKIDYYNTGNNANAEFAEWGLSSVYEQCGTFDRYAITADSSNSPHLTFPTPGLTLSTHCTQTSQCLNVRVYTYTIRTYQFMLWLYPKYGQDPVGIPYYVDISPCWNYATLGVSSQPSQLTLDKSPNANAVTPNAIHPQWLSLFSNNYASNCPLITVELLNSGGGALSTDRMSLVNPSAPTTSRIDVVVDTHFTMTIRIKAYTMAKNAFLSLTIRVCGAESINLVSTNTRFYIDGIAVGNVNSMSDATRYITIPQSTFASWFTVSPGGDPCIIDQFTIWGQVSPSTSSFPDTQAQLLGSFGSHSIKIDKTIATNTRTFYLRARTRGLKTVDQRIDFVICPKTGGVVITPPAAYSPTTVDQTGGSQYNLATNSLYQRINYQASGTNANAVYAQWQMTELYQGCGVFWRYDTSADSNNSPYLTYPEPGYSYSSNCQTITQCLRVRVYSNTIRKYSFTLQLYPVHGQDPVGIPYYVDVTPCLTSATFTRSQDPPQLVLSRSGSSGNKYQMNIYPTYFNNFANNQATHCPVLRYSILTTSGSALNDVRFTLENSQSKTTARVDVINDQPFTHSIRIQADTMSKNAYQTLSIRVCGVETIALTSSSRRFHILGFERGTPSGMSESTRYLVIPESTFSTYFAVSPSGDPCTIDQYSIYSAISPETSWPSGDPQVLLTGSLGSMKLKIDKTMATNTRSVWLRARTRGLITVDQKIDFVVCPATGGVTVTPSPAATPSTRDITGGSEITLQSNSLYFEIDEDATGTAANVPFAAWQIADAYEGCGSFEKYGITGIAPNSNYAQFPEPGLTLASCTQIGQCLNVRILNTNTPVIVQFQLQLFPIVGQDPIQIPYYVDVSPCRLASLTVTQHPPDLVIDRTNTTGNINQYAINPAYHTRITSNKLSQCPVLDYQILDSSDTVLNHNQITLVNPGSPNTARIDVQNDAAFTKQTKLQGITMNKNVAMNLLIRVCGEETVSLVNNSPQQYLLNFARGTPSSLAANVRHHQIDHATMMAFFSLSPSNDPCIIHHLSRHFTSSQLATKASLDSEAFLVGSFNNADYFQIDKTVATDVVSVKLRAETRGMIQVEKTIEYVVCPPTGGNTIVTPTPYWEQIITYNGQQMLRKIALLNQQTVQGQQAPTLSQLDYSIHSTGGNTLTLTSEELYMQIDVGSSGSAANIPFTGWTIADVYRGCGTFSHYSVVGSDSVSAAIIAFPETGTSLNQCALISQCQNVRVTDTSQPRIIKFRLHLHPVVEQDSVSIPFVIDLTPCRVSTLTVPNPPSTLVMDRVNTIGNLVTVDVNPTYASLLVNSAGSNCPILSWQIKDSSGNALTTSNVVMLNSETPAQSKLQIKNDVPFSLSLRVLGTTMSQQQHMNLQVTVCGTETLTLVNPLKKTFIMGQESRPVNTLSDAERYFTIDESVFSQYFQFGPSNNPCVVNHYEIYQAPTIVVVGGNTIEIPAPQNNQITMTGSLGSFQLRLDKTLQTGVRSTQLRSKTRGYVVADQDMEFVICPNDGASTVTPPAAHSQSVVDATNGQEITLQAGSLYQKINIGASGNAANFNFGAWSIADIYPGCGVFWKYGITGTAANLAKLQYPVPGLTLSSDCTSITDCLAVRITDTSNRVIIQFELQLYAQYGANPVSVPVVIDVTPCDTASFTVPTPIQDLIISKSIVQGSTIPVEMNPSYSIKYISSTTYCPITDFELLNSNGAALSHSQITFEDGAIPLQTKIYVTNQQAFSQQVNLKAYTMSKNALMPFTIRVCGVETMALTNSAQQFFIFGHETGSTSGMADSTRYNTLAESTFAAYFNHQPSGDPCIVNSYSLYSSILPMTAWDVTDSRIKIAGSLGSYTIKLDKTVPTNGLTFFLKAQTMGLVSIEKQIQYSICPRTGGARIESPGNQIFYSVNLGASGTAANANFAPWTLQDIYTGCGAFWKYTIEGTAANLQYLQYPEPGKSLSADCTTVSSCVAVRVLDTSSYREIDFTLKLYAKYNQDPVSVPFKIEIFPCNSESLSANTPPQLVLNRSPITGNFAQNAINPQWMNLFISSNPTRCPVIQFEIKDTSGNAWTEPKVALYNGQSPFTARVDVRNDAILNQQLRLYGATSVKNAFMVLNIRVCGEETIALVNSAKKNYIDGVQIADPSSLSDSDRYIIIEESTFSTWFSVSPNNDPCSVDQYKIYTSANGNTEWSGTQVLLTGSLGSYKLKIDRTVATNAQSVYLRAYTRGLVTASQQVEWVICPKTGGSTVTKAQTIETNIINSPDPATTLYQQIQHGASGSGLHANFDGWQIADVYQGCGSFLRYAVVASDNIISYPQSGVSQSTCDNNINSCKKIQFSNANTYQRYTFTLQFYPKYGQDPTSISYVVDVTRCQNSLLSGATTLSASNPQDLVLDKNPNANHFSSFVIKNTYVTQFTSNRAECPLIRYDLKDASGNDLNYPAITMQDGLDKDQATMKVVDDSHFSTTIRMKGYTLSRNTYFTLNVRVCGAETISVVSSAKQTFVFDFEPGSTTGMADSVRYYDVPQSAFLQYFSISPNNDPCTIDEYSLVFTGLLAPETQITLHGTIGQNLVVRVDKTQQFGTRNLKLKARTRGLNFIEKDLEFILCPRIGGALASAAEASLYVSVDQNTAGTTANANFLPFTVSEPIPGCGSFDKYAIVAAADVLAILQYPEPGKTLSDCPSPSSCTAIRVLDTSQIRTVSLTLQLWFHYSQDPINVPMQIEIYPCNTAQFTVPTHPPQLTIDRSLSQSGYEDVDISPLYRDLYISSVPAHCPVARFELKQTNLQAWTDSSISLLNPSAVSTAKIRVTTGQGFWTKQFRLKGFTVSLNTIMNMDFRVCGAETLTLAQSAKKEYIFGVETGDVNTMQDATRYIIIPESTFSTWFVVGPSGDPCIIKDYEIFSSIDPYTAWSSNQVLLTGSPGSYLLKIDKTVSTDATSVYLRAMTRGRIYATQQIEWVICPKTGGSTVTKPLTIETNVLNSPDPSTVLYQQVRHGSSSTQLNANFNIWQIADVYQGCGKFLRYTIDGGDSNQFTYPEPGVSQSGTCDNNIASCRAIRLNSASTHRRLTFTLKLQPDYGQNPVSIEYVVDVTRCLSSYTETATTLTVSAPDDLVMDRFSAQNHFTLIDMAPYYRDRFTSSRNSECPIIRYDLLDTSNNALNNPAITLTTPFVAATSQLKVTDSSLFSTTVRIKGYTLSRTSNYNLNVRVCGAETLALASNTRRFFPLGFARGSPVSMSDSDRYFTIDESTFAPFFTVSPSGDPCTIKEYQIYSSISPLTQWPSGDASVLLTGSLNTYKLKFDKTISTNTKSVYLRAITRGLVTIDQQIDFVVCPSTGGVTVTPPTPYSPTIVNATTGVKVNLQSKSLYQIIDVGTSNTAANAAFGAWQIADVYEGCGQFWKYAIDANSTTLPLLTYPVPGNTLSTDCAVIGNCLNIRVADTSVQKRLHFTLKLYPMFSQDPISIPYVVDLTPCQTASLSVSSNPADWVLDRELTSVTTKKLMQDTYLSQIQNSQNSLCPVIVYDLLDNQDAPLVSNKVFLENHDIRETAKLVVEQSSFFTLPLKIRAFTMSKNTVMNLNVRVCGAETLTLADSAVKHFVQGIDPSATGNAQYYSINEATFAQWFVLGPSNDPCTVDKYVIMEETLAAEQPSDPGNKITLAGTLGSHTLKFNKVTAQMTLFVWLRARTRGKVTVDQKIEFAVCPKTGASYVYPPGNLQELSGIVDTGASGTSANFNFQKWFILHHALYRGCGDFWKYTVSGDSSMTQYLQFPEPGKTLSTDCVTTEDCLAVRVTDTSVARRITFTLSLVPQHGQDAVGIPVTLDVTPCRLQTLSVPVPPSDLIVSRKWGNEATQEIAFTDFLSKFVSTSSNCPVTGLEFTDMTPPSSGGGRRLSTPAVTMTGLDNPSSAKIVVFSSNPITVPIKVKASTLTASAEMTFNVRVCGDEEISLTDPAKIFKVNAQANGQYDETTQATIASWFTVTPSGDACGIDKFEIYSNEKNENNMNILWPSSDTSAALTGSFGSHVLKVDLTNAFNTKQLFMRAYTKGFKQANKQFEFVVCRPDNSVTVLPPSESIYAAVDVGSTNAAANAVFAAWNIQDIYAGCGKFWKYGITGPSATLAKLQYPEPGKTLSTDCTTENDCLAVRVTDTSVAVKLEFNLVLYPQFSQQPVVVPMVVDVTPCTPATLTLSGRIANVFLEQAQLATSIHRIDIDQTYGPMFVSSLPQACPLVSMEVLNKDGSAFSSHFLTFNQVNAGDYYLDVKTGYPEIKRILLKACIQTTCAQTYFNVRVCGSEQLNLLNSTAKVFTVGYQAGDAAAIAAMNDTTRYFSLDEATFKEYYQLVPAIDSCTVIAYELQETQYVAVSNAFSKVALTGLFGTMKMKIDKTIFTTSQQDIFLVARTKGRVHAYQPMKYEVCSPDALQLSSAAAQVWAVFSLKDGTNDQKFINKSQYVNLFQVTGCQGCPIQSYRILNSDNTTYTGSVFSLDEEQNIKVSTYIPYKATPLWLEAYYTSSQADCAAFMNPQRIKLDLEVCGTEQVIVNNETETLYFHNWISTDPNYKLNLTEMATNFTLNSTTCQIEKWELRDIKDYSLTETGETVWSQFIKINQNTKMIEVNHNRAPAMDNNTEFTIYLTAVTNGQAYNAKTLHFKFSTMQTNILSMIQTTTNQLAEIQLQKEREEALLLAAEEKARQDAIIAKFKKVEPELPPEIPLDVEYIEATKRIADETAKVEKQLAGQQNVEIGGAAVALPKGKPPTPVVNERTKKIADKRVVAALFAQFNEQKARTTFEEPTDAAGEDVGIKVGAMSRDGKLGIGFNQPLVVPPFNSDSASKGRSLGISVEELDVTRDVLNFEYVSGSGDGDIAYDIFISKWDESGISLQLNFSDPLAVSQGRGNDRAVVAIKNPGLFVSKKTGKMIQAENAVAVQKVPRQTPAGVDAEALERQARGIMITIRVIVLVEVGVHVAAGMSLEPLWALFFTLQFLCYIKVYDAPMPANVQIYMDHLTSMVELDMFNPQTLIQFWDEDFRFNNWFSSMVPSLMFDPDMEQSIFNDLQIYVFIAIFGLICLLIFLIMKKIRQDTDKEDWYDLKWAQIKQSLIWNLVIRSAMVMYLKCCISVGTQMRLALEAYEFQTPLEKLFALILGGLVLAVPILTWLTLQKYRGLLAELVELKQRQRIGTLYTGIHLFRGRTNLYFFPLFLTRRIVFVLIPSLMYAFPVFQLQLLLFTTLGYMAFYTSTRPHKDHSRVKQETFNDWMILVACYHMLTFSGFSLDPYATFSMGYSYVTFSVLTVSVNLCFVGFEIFGKWNRKRLFKLKRAWAKRMYERRSGGILKNLMAQSKDLYRQGEEGEEFEEEDIEGPAFAAPKVAASSRRSPMKSRMGRFNTQNLKKLPMDMIEEENEQSVADFDSKSFAQLPSKDKGKRKNAIYTQEEVLDAATREKLKEQNLQEEEDNSRSRWYEYYRGIGYTNDVLVEMGLTKDVDMKSAPAVDVKSIMKQLQKDVKKRVVSKQPGQALPPAVTSSARKPTFSEYAQSQPPAKKQVTIVEQSESSSEPEEDSSGAEDAASVMDAVSVVSESTEQSLPTAIQPMQGVSNRLRNDVQQQIVSNKLQTEVRNRFANPARREEITNLEQDYSKAKDVLKQIKNDLKNKYKSAKDGK